MCVTVSIVLHRTDPKLIESVLTCLRDEPVERIYLIDNSPTDSLRSFGQHDARLEYHHVPNRGYGNGHNFAIKKALGANADFHLVLNADVRWEGQILNTLTRRFSDSSKTGLVQPRICYPDGRLQHSCRLLPTPLDVFAKRFLPSKYIEKRMNRYLLPESAYSQGFNAVYMQGSFMLFRMSALREIGLFDERFFMYPEDIDITRRIRSKYDAEYVPEVSIVHDHRAASAKFGRMLWIHIVNMCRYFNKWGWFFDPGRRRLNKQLLKELKDRGIKN